MNDSDTIWIEFLSSLYDDSLYKEGEDNEEEEEVNDPEYIISEDIKQIYDDWDFRNDRAVKVSDHELDLLFDEQQNDIEVDSIETTIVASNQNIDSNVFNTENLQILVEQLRQHIQLLAQTYLQSTNISSLESVAQNAKSMLNQIYDYSQLKTNSIFSVNNLKPAIDLINNYPIEKCPKTITSLTSWRSLPVTKENQKIFISNPDVFLSPWLLPYCGYYDKRRDDKNKCKTVFTLAEDHLIAIGLEQFTPMFSLRKCYSYIKQLLLPIKTVDQIRTRIKNVKRRSNDIDLNENPILFYSLNNQVLETHSGIIDPKFDTYFFCKSVPEWYKKSLNSKQTIPRKKAIESFSAPSCSQSKSKKFKSATESQNDRKKAFISQQSPVKQTSSIVKKYRYLNRINPLKQTLTVMSNSRSNKCLPNSTVTSCAIEIIDVPQEDLKAESVASEPICSRVDTKESHDTRNNSSPLEESVNVKEESHVSDTSPTNDLNMNEDDNEKPVDYNNINEEDIECDDESDLAALMTASSTITAKNKIKSKNNEISNSTLLSLSHGKKEGRKSLAVKQRESTLQMLSLESNESDPNSEHKEEVLVHYYLEKVRKSLIHEDFVRFLTLLSEFHRKRNQEPKTPGLIKQLYYQIEQFLRQSNVSKDIISEFVLFLSAEQAEECGKMFDYLYWKRFFNFVRKLEIYSSVDPQCLQRLLRSLNQLKQNEENIDRAKIRSTVSKVLNGHTYLMHEFSSLFLDEKPSQYLFEDEDFDEIVIESSDEEDKNDSSDKICFENINIPDNDEELKYGTNECPCKMCHIPSQPIGSHCISCSIRFIGGRVYLAQNHKKLHLAEIRYHENDSQLNKAVINNEANKQLGEEEEINVESDNDIERDIGSPDKTGENNPEQIKWTISQDKMLLELCRSKVIEEKRNDLSEEIFEEAAFKLSRNTSDVIARFNQLMELFASEQETGREIEDNN